jgi:Helix-turn-helix domain
MHDKRRWLPRWQRVELVELCLVQGLTRRQAAAWRRVSVSTVQYWVERRRQASEEDRVSGAWGAPQPPSRFRSSYVSACETGRRVRRAWRPSLWRNPADRLFGFHPFYLATSQSDDTSSAPIAASEPVTASK